MAYPCLRREDRESLDLGSNAGLVQPAPPYMDAVHGGGYRGCLFRATATRDFPSIAPVISAIASTKQCEPARSVIRPSAYYAGGRPTLTLPRTLIADDHQSLLKAEGALLSPHFDVVGTAADGAALVSEACRLHPDVVVTDISMPILNGIDAVHKLRELGSTAKFVFVTVQATREFVDACMQAGAFGFVQKACLKHDLVPAIKAALAGKIYVSRIDSDTSRKRVG